MFTLLPLVIKLVIVRIYSSRFVYTATFICTKIQCKDRVIYKNTQFNRKNYIKSCR